MRLVRSASLLPRLVWQPSRTASLPRRLLGTPPRTMPALITAWLTKPPGAHTAAAAAAADKSSSGPAAVLQYGPLLPGKLVKRYKRFLADVQIEGENGPTEVTAHCPNTGPMIGLLDWPLAPCWVSTAPPGSKRKCAHTLEVLQAAEEGPWVNVHSASANAQVKSIIEQRLVPELAAWASFKPEVKYGQDGGSRIDFLLTGRDGVKTYVEVKSVTLTEALPAAERAQEGGDPPPHGRIALWPDATTERGRKHVRELQAVVAAGHRALCLFLIQRPDCTAFAPGFAYDQEYGRLLVEAHSQGVGILALACRPQPQERGGVAEFVGSVPVDLTYKADYEPPAKVKKPRKRKAAAAPAAAAAAGAAE